VKTLREAAESGASVEAMELDLASLSSVRAFATALERRVASGALPPLHGLVCNAGMQGAKVLTADGFEATFAVNHLAHYLLVRLLLPLLAKPSRIAVVASGVHDPAQLEAVPMAGVPAPAWNLPAALAKGELGPAAANDDANADRGRRYSTSKLANVYFTYALAPLLAEGVTVNAFDPGLMPGTGLAREYSAPMRWLWVHVMPRMLPLMRLLITKNIHTTEASGAALARLITDPALASTSGKYFEGLREIPSSVDSYDADRAAELWKDSAALTRFA
jgi:NAD(P)-dependent dehydrogenase (short-subunit alcohol dehydrogenase family)